jgi:hypothetical protein
MKQHFAELFSFIGRHKMLVVWPLGVFLLVLAVSLFLTWSPSSALAIYRR